MNNKFFNSLNHIKVPNNIVKLSIQQRETDIIGMYVAIYRKINMDDNIFTLSDEEISRLSQTTFTKANIHRFRKRMIKILNILKEAGYIVDYSLPRQQIIINTDYDRFMSIEEDDENIRILSRYDYTTIVNGIYELEANTVNAFGQYKVSAWDSIALFIYLKTQMFQWHPNPNKQGWAKKPTVAKIVYEDIFTDMAFSAAKVKLIFDMLKELDLIEFSKPIKYLNDYGKTRYGRTIVVEKTPVSQKKLPWQEEFRNGINEYSNFLRNKGLFVPAYNHGLTASNFEERELY